MNHAALLIHVVWTTRLREPLITASVAQFLVRYLPAVARQENATVLAMGVVSTHIHLLVSLDPTTGIPRLVQRFKGGSSRLAEIEGHTTVLQWAAGYSVTSVSRRNVQSVLAYLESQPQHHPDFAIKDWPGYVSFVPAGTL